MNPENPSAVAIQAIGPVLDHEATRILSREISVALRCGVGAIAVDLGAVETIDESGVAALAALHRNAPRDARIALTGVRDGLLVMAEATHLQELFEIYATPESALRAMARAAGER